MSLTLKAEIICDLAGGGDPYPFCKGTTLKGMHTVDPRALVGYLTFSSWPAQMLLSRGPLKSVGRGILPSKFLQFYCLGSERSGRNKSRQETRVCGNAFSSPSGNRDATCDFSRTYYAFHVSQACTARDFQGITSFPPEVFPT